MYIVSTEKIDGWGGNVIPGEPVNGDLVRITYSTGTVKEKYYREVTPPPDPTYVYVHIDVSGPVSGGIVSIPNDGVTDATITFTLRETEDPGSAILDTITRNWSLALRDSDGMIYDHIGIRYVNGVATIQYTNTKASMVLIQDRDVEDVVGTAIVKLATAPRFLVYRSFI